MHILLIDDEQDFLLVLKQRLEQRNFTVEGVETGTEALSLIAKQPFDVVLLDMKLKNEDGLELLRSLKKRSPTLPIFILSGHASVESAMQAVEAGAVDYLLKPLALNDLINRLKEVSRA